VRAIEDKTKGKDQGKDKGKDKYKNQLEASALSTDVRKQEAPIVPVWVKSLNRKKIFWVAFLYTFMCIALSAFTMTNLIQKNQTQSNESELQKLQATFEQREKLWQEQNQNKLENTQHRENEFKTETQKLQELIEQQNHTILDLQEKIKTIQGHTVKDLIQVSPPAKTDLTATDYSFKNYQLLRAEQEEEYQNLEDQLTAKENAIQLQINRDDPIQQKGWNNLKRQHAKLLRDLKIKQDNDRYQYASKKK
jgi:hypothetical protein